VRAGAQLWQDTVAAAVDGHPPALEGVDGELQRDVGRTFPRLPALRDECGRGQLFATLRAFAMLRPDVGYCQGIN